MPQKIQVNPDLHGDSNGRGRRLNVVLSILVAAEALVLWGAAIWLVSSLSIQSPESVRTAIALIVLTIVGALWVSATAIALVRRVRWSRGSAITWQVLQASVAFGALSYWQFSLALLIPAVVVVLLAVAPSVRAAHGIDEREN